MDIRNEQEFVTMMEKLLREVLDGITKEVIDIFKEKYIRRYVYSSPDSHGPNKMYHGGTRKPTYEFEGAWSWTPIKKQLETLSTEMWFNPSKLTFDDSTFRHGSIYSTPEDVRASLMDILNKEGYSSSLWLSVKRKEAYWNKFLEDMFSSGELGRIVSKHFLSKGFTQT